VANKARGFVSVELPGGTYDVGLSLDTLAALEDEFKVEHFEEAFKVVGANARESRRFFTCIFRGSGYELTDTVKRDIGSITVPGAVDLLNQLMVLGGMKAAEGEPGAAGPLEPASPDPTAGESG
jgi:hypothetical protein